MEDFNGTALVAFADLCGFKKHVLKNRRTAYNALDQLYNNAYDLAQSNHGVRALAVSDCVIAWVPSDGTNLDRLLSYLQALHRDMLAGGYLMRTSIAKGEFCYKERIELRNLNKNMLYGGAYLDAFRANDRGEVGSIGIVHHASLGEPKQFAPEHAKFIRRERPEGRGNWEFFWSVKNERDIERLKQGRRDSYNARFSHLIQVYRGEANP